MMGCDIHCHVEVKIHGKWEHYNQPYIRRNYDLFCKMAGVRQYDENSPVPMSLAKGLPDDCSVMTKFDADQWGIDGHDHSWFSAKEAQEIQEWYEEQENKNNMHPPLFGYVFDNSIGSLEMYPDDSNELRKAGCTDVRIVFWFDN